MKMWGLSSAGRAPAWHAGGQRFDPARLHHFHAKPIEIGGYLGQLIAAPSFLPTFNSRLGRAFACAFALVVCSGACGPPSNWDQRSKNRLPLTLGSDLRSTNVPLTSKSGEVLTSSTLLKFRLTRSRTTSFCLKGVLVFSSTKSLPRRPSEPCA